MRVYLGGEFCCQFEQQGLGLARLTSLLQQVGKQQARRRGVQIVAPKIPAMVDQVAALQAGTSQPVVVFCWRGGMRSLALVQFLELAGVPARQLSGGHKGFRRMVLDFFEHGEWGRLLVFRGLTGVGKTEYLQRLAEKGYPVVDLEGLANHRGSAFGNLGLNMDIVYNIGDAVNKIGFGLVIYSLSRKEA